MKNELIKTEKDKLYLKEIIELRTYCRNGFGNKLKSAKYRYLLEWLDSKTPLLQDTKYTITTKLYWLVNGLTDFPVCMFCGKTKMTGNVESLEGGYFRACSAGCDGMKKARVRKIEKTCVAKWGASSFFGSAAGRKAKEKWCAEHGVENPFQLEEIKEKSRQTRKERFGCEYTMQSAEKRSLAAKNYRTKTGYSHQFADPSVIQKVKKTKEELRNSGVDLYEKHKALNRARRYTGFVNNGEIEPLFSEQQFTRLDALSQYTTLLEWRCKKCGNIFKACVDQNFSSRFGIPVRCEKCHPVEFEGTSGLEKELIGFIQDECRADVVENDRSIIAPYEVDAYLPDRKLAVEFDGLYWHSEGAGKDRTYHLAKTEMCSNVGIRLVHVFEDEWRDKKQIVKSRFMNMLGMFSRTVFARKCEIHEVSPCKSREFQDLNHMQGAVNASVRLGLYDGEELVALMTFGRCRFGRRHEWEMLRFCCRCGCHVPGAAGRLLKHFEKNWRPASLVSYADRRWSQGNLYRALGFSFVGNSPPGYFYVKGDKRYSRIAFQKHKLAKILPVFDPAKTEVENMRVNGYYRIFDCGNLVFEKTYPENVS